MKVDPLLLGEENPTGDEQAEPDHEVTHRFVDWPADSHNISARNRGCHLFLWGKCPKEEVSHDTGTTAQTGHDECQTHVPYVESEMLG